MKCEKCSTEIEENHQDVCGTIEPFPENILKLIDIIRKNPELFKNVYDKIFSCEKVVVYKYSHEQMIAKITKNIVFCDLVKKELSLDEFQQKLKYRELDYTLSLIKTKTFRQLNEIGDHDEYERWLSHYTLNQ